MFVFADHRVLMLVAALAVAGLSYGLAAEPAPALSPDQIIQKALLRAESATAHTVRPDYRYTKHTVTEQIDTTGRLKDRKEKLYDVLVENGLSFLKLTQLNGQSLSPADQKKEQDRDLAERQKLTDAKPGQKGDERENFLTADLIGKYTFKLVGEPVINGRPVYRLAFAPKPNLPAHKVTDRFLNQIAGTVWIDAQEFEIARAEIHLQGEVSLWGGIIGTLRECSYTLERTRLADGAWFNHSSRGMFSGRKLLEPMLIRTRSESSDFRPVALAGK